MYTVPDRPGEAMMSTCPRQEAGHVLELLGTAVEALTIPRPLLSLTYHVTKPLRAGISINMTTRLEVGSQGKLGGQSHVPDFEGIWFELVRNVCPLLNFLLAPDLNVCQVNCMCLSLTD